MYAWCSARTHYKHQYAELGRDFVLKCGSRYLTRLYPELSHRVTIK